MRELMSQGLIMRKQIYAKEKHVCWTLSRKNNHYLKQKRPKWLGYPSKEVYEAKLAAGLIEKKKKHKRIMQAVHQQQYNRKRDPNQMDSSSSTVAA